MKKLYFHYHMDISFEDIVRNHHFTLKCTPKSDEKQTIENLKVNVYPNQYVSESTDAYHNISLTGYAPIDHDTFYIDVTGLASTGLDKEKQYDDIYKIGYYKYHTPITKPDDIIIQYFAKFDLSKCNTNLEKANLFMKQLYQDFEYVPGITSIQTTAEQALRLGKGVCQDYAHILISLCKMASIPARYVVGLLVGEGYSHAWVEIFQTNPNNPIQGHWIGIDPTNNLIVDDTHIKISCGRDYEDCIINQGSFLGGGKQTQNISVIVYEAFHEQ